MSRICKKGTLRRKLTLRLSALLLMFLVLLGGTYVAVLSAVSAKEYDSIVVNLAGRQRMLTQRYAGEIYQVFVALMLSDRERAGEMKEESSKTAELYETTHQALLDGGWVETGDRELVEIPAVREDFIVEHLGNVEIEWQELRRAAARVLRSDARSMADDHLVALFHEQTVKAVSEMDEVVTHMQNRS